jgi:hypothetical protein
MFNQDFWDAVLSTLPPLGMAVLVYVLFKSIIGADAKERKTYAEIEAQERAKAGLPLKAEAKPAPKAK